MALIGASNSLGGLAGSNSIARLLVVISGDASGLSAAVAQAEGSLAGLNSNASSIGKILTRSLTLPLLAIGGLATKMAIDFEAALGRVAALTPLTEQVEGGIDGVRESIMAMAQDPLVTAGPTDLAEALYFAGSAGLSASDAMAVTQLSAQAMSVGMGSAADVAKVLIFALNNYPGGALSAASAMDTLTVAIKEGTAEPDELAVALGRLLPVAAQAGITFQEVTASVSALSNLGVPVRVATTSLRALFSQLLAPTIQATELLDQLGISAEELRGSLEEGPVAAFQLLLEATHGNIDALHDIIPQIRGFTAFLGLTGDKAERYNKILEAMANKQGAFRESLEVFAETPGFKFEKALQSLKIAGIQLGQQLIPVFERIVMVIQDMAETFSHLPAPILAVGAALITIAAAIGPIMQVYGAMTQLRQVGMFMAPTFKAMATSLAVAGAAAVAAGAGLSSMAQGSTNLVSVGTALIGTFLALKLGIQGVRDVISAIPGVARLAGTTLGRMFLGLGGPQITAIALAITAVGVALAYVNGKAHELERLGQDLTESFTSGGQAGETFASMIDKIADESAAATLKDIATSIGLINSQINATNLGQFRQGIGAQLATDLEALDDLQLDEAFTVPEGLDEIATDISLGARAGQDLNDILAQSGTNVDALLDDLGNLSVSPEGAELAHQIEEIIFQYNAAGDAQVALESSTAGLIATHSEEQAAVEQLATQYGVSVPFMQSKLGEFGVTATGVMGENQDAFGEAALGVNSFGQDVGAVATEAESAIAGMVAAMADSLQSGFTVFGELPEKFKGDVDKMIKTAQALGQSALDTSQNIVALQKAGIPAGLIDQLIAAGPAALDKFASATPAQMQKIVDAYSVGLAAMDEEILKEGAHQEVKGKNMVANFAGAILGSSHLTQGAAKEIINHVVSEFEAGHLTEKQLGIVADFTRGLGHVKGISQREAHQAVLAFVRGLAAGKGAEAGGRKLVQGLAAGIAKAKGITLAQARDLVSSVKTQITGKTAEVNNAGNKLGVEIGRGLAQGADSQKGNVNNAGNRLASEAKSGLSHADEGAFQMGSQVGAQFAAGINSQASAAAAAARNLANASKQAMDDGLKNSPEYFTYYMGKKLVTDMAKGVREESGKMPGHRPTFVGGVKGGTDMARLGEILRNGGQSVEVHVHGNVYADDFDGRVVDAVNRAGRPRARGHRR